MINVDLNIKRKVMITIVIILLLFSTLIIFYQYNIVKNNFNQKITTLNQMIYKSFDIFSDELKINIATKSDLIINLPKLRIAFNNQNRKELLAIVEPFYKRMSAQNPYIKIMTFRFPDGSAFLRVHKPKMFGDSLNEKRTIILDTNRLRKRQYGFEVGKLMMTYRIVTPIYYENKYLGLVEIGVKPEYFTDKLDKLFDIKNAFLVKTATFLMVTEEMKKNSIEDYVLVQGDGLFKKQLSTIELTEGFRIVDRDKNYIIAPDLDVLNNRNKVVAKILLAYNIDNYLHKVDEVIFDIILHMFFLGLVLIIILHYFINSLLKKMNILNIALTAKSLELENFNTKLVDKVEKEITKSRKIDKQLIAQSRMVQMGEILSMIAHQWRQPLAAISATSAYIEIKAKKNNLDNAMALKKAQDISSFSEHLSSTIDNFRSFFKPHKEKIHTSYDEVVLSVEELMRLSITNKNIELILELNSNESLYTYKNELQQVILNLVKNAEEAIYIQKVDSPVIKIVTYTHEEQYVLEVHDNAGGVEEEIIHEIFNPYFSTKLEKDGSGLGLYMSKMIIEEHCAGELSVKNGRDGAIFSMILDNRTDKKEAINENS